MPLTDGRIGVGGLGIQLERRRDAQPVPLGGVQQHGVELGRLPAEDGIDAGPPQRGKVAVQAARALGGRQRLGTARCSRCLG